MSTPVIMPDRFRAAIEAERAKPAQRNLFTGEIEAVAVEIEEPIPADFTEIDDGISLVKTDDLAQLILSGFGLFSWQEE